MNNSYIKSLDPVQGLIDYVLDVKPYHTKIIEVLIEYVYTDAVNVSITENLQFDIGLTYQSCYTQLGPIQSYNFGSPDSIVMMGDVTDLLVTNFVAINGSMNATLDGEYEIDSSSYNAGTNKTTIVLTTSLPGSLLSGFGNLFIAQEVGNCSAGFVNNLLVRTQFAESVSFEFADGDNAAPIAGVPAIGGFDGPQFDVGGMDEDMNTLNQTNS